MQQEVSVFGACGCGMLCLAWRGAGRSWLLSDVRVEEAERRLQFLLGQGQSLLLLWLLEKLHSFLHPSPALGSGEQSTTMSCC